MVPGQHVLCSDLGKIGCSAGRVDSMVTVENIMYIFTLQILMSGHCAGGSKCETH